MTMGRAAALELSPGIIAYFCQSRLQILRHVFKLALVGLEELQFAF